MSSPRMELSSDHKDNAPMPPVEARDFVDTQDDVAFIRDHDGHATAAASDPSHETAHPKTAGDTIILRTHDGDSYVLPYRPWEITKLYVEDIYRLRDRKTLADAVKHGNSGLMDQDGNIILPSLWSQVVKPGGTVQIVLPLEILNPDIEKRYRYDDNAPRSRSRSRRPSKANSLNSARDRSHDSGPKSRYRSHSPSNSSWPYNAGDRSPRRAGIERESEYEGSGESEYFSDASSGASEDLDLESVSGESDVSETSTVAVTSIPDIRKAIMPTDEDGNNLVFKAHTSLKEALDQDTANADNTTSKREPQKSTAQSESISIAKAVSSQTDNRTFLQVSILKGPRTSSTSVDEEIRWFHLRSSPLDLSGFKDTCLSIPGLSRRLQDLVRKTFDKVEKEKVRISLDGMFIEPGTVLRADEVDQSDPESVIFSCITYFDLQNPVKKKSGTAQVNRFPSRTLMQSYYPYEPVQDRDAEQAYRKFGNEQRDALVHVPSLWVVNIGSNTVATCGHQALQDGFVQSIKLVSIEQKDDVSQCDIRLTDWEGRRLLFTVEECRSFFQMEQKLKELRWCSSRSRNRSSGEDESLQLSWQLKDEKIKVTPALWPGILRQRDRLFIDLSLSSDENSDQRRGDATPVKTPVALIPNPFFEWPQKSGTEDAETKLLLSDKIRRSIQCLELVEKAITSEVLRSDDSYGAVEKSFTSTEYYRALAQSTLSGTRVGLQTLQIRQRQLKKPTQDQYTSHRAVVLRQQTMVAQKASELHEVMETTLALFVTDVDKSTMLRKAWAAMQNICDLATAVMERKPHDSDFDKLADEDPADPPSAPRKWYIRPDISDPVTSEPLQKLKQSFANCRKCRRFDTYKTSQAAVLHVEKHFKHVGGVDASIKAPKDCIINRSQMLLEVINKGTVDILTRACEKAQQLLTQSQELSHGVLNEDGQMSDLYTLPRSMLGAFRQLLVFYFAVERAMFYGEESFTIATGETTKSDWGSLTSFSASLEAIETFAGGVQQALTAVRGELCSMVKSSGPIEIFKRLSLSPEYVCSWFMRRLIVKPLERSMTISDMYREYLSTIQFQVNHRPSKRLLRSINLLQEEIAAILEVNTHQSKLVSNYMSVLDDTTYEKDIPYRRAMFPYERMLLESCLDSLKMTDQECRYLLARCGPLSDSTKQSLEINEEDHGKAILVFTVVTVIFLPLSFVTSYLGMNTTDIRDMGSTSTLFWAIAIPLTAVTMGSVMYIGYNGDDLRDFVSSLYRNVTGKQDRSIGARGISVAQRKMARRSADSGSTLDFSSLADEAEFANPRPEDHQRSGYYRSTYAQPSRRQYSLDPPALQWEPYTRIAEPIVIPEPRTGLRSQTRNDEWYTPVPVVSEVPISGKAAGRTSEYLPPDEDYIKQRPLAPGYERTRTESRRKARTYAEPISLEIPPVPISYAQRTRHDESRYSRPAGRSSEQREADPPHYEWTKQRHRNSRSTRDRPRRRSRSRRHDIE